METWLETQDRATIAQQLDNLAYYRADLIERHHGDRYFALWLYRVNRVLVRGFSVSLDDLADWSARGSYEAGDSPSQGAKAAIEHDEWLGCMAPDIEATAVIASHVRSTVCPGCGSRIDEALIVEHCQDQCDQRLLGRPNGGGA